MNNFQKKYKDNFLLCMFFDISMTPALMIYSWILPAIHQPQEMKWVKIDGKGQYKKFASLHICLTGETIKQMFDFLGEMCYNMVGRNSYLQVGTFANL